MTNCHGLKTTAADGNMFIPLIFAKFYENTGMAVGISLLYNSKYSSLNPLVSARRKLQVCVAHPLWN